MAYKRKTKDKYLIQAYYGYWEEVGCEDSKEIGLMRLEAYRKNEWPTQFKLVKKRIKI